MPRDTGPPEKKRSCPTGLALWMVKASLPEHLQEETLNAFKDQFLEVVKKRGKTAAHIWALQASWEIFYQRYEAMLWLIGFFVTLAGFILAIVAI